jgi:exonuclease III
MKKPLILCLSETHLTKTITNKEIKINGYNYEQCPSENTITGGVIIFIKQRHKYKVRGDQEGLFKLVTLNCILNRITGVTSSC